MKKIVDELQSNFLRRGNDNHEKHAEQVFIHGLWASIQNQQGWFKIVDKNHASLKLHIICQASGANKTRVQQRGGSLGETQFWT